LLVPEALAPPLVSPTANKMSIALRLAHKPGALLAALEPFSRHGVNLQKIESRPIHGRPFEYQFYLDIESSSPEAINAALAEVRSSTTFLRTLGLYPSASRS
jgi:prephenate dehydratase